MSRSQSSDISNTASANSAADQTAGTTAQTAENADIGNYEGQLSQYAAANPYTSGGEYQTSQNQTLAADADVGSTALQNQLQTQAQRTGQNAGAANATAAEQAQQNEMGLSSAEGAANTSRIGDEAGYSQSVLSASALPAQLEAGEASTDLGAANSQLGTAESASAASPSFWDELLQGSMAAGQSAAGAAAGAAAKGCWVAAELYGGWMEPRTVEVREWIFGEFLQSWYGKSIANLYLRFGERTATAIRRFPFLRRIFLPIFNAALAQARKGK